MNAQPVTPLSPRNAGHARAASISSTTVLITPKDAARARWRKIRSAATALRSLRDRKRSESGGAGRVTISSAANASRPHHALQVNANIAAMYGAKRSDARSVAMQMDAWHARKRDLFQRVVSKPCVFF